ncbi:hypothetical protein [Amycolatopsis sp. H20-H5]|uniref:hypothetical protein n=1 Tax=Amycolatopsis sp. H20-H5 TaxID=3046309 RepID=UPI002DB6459C|nr:hypothetical protein [Amycolatopsis sp. H20-H5]MEC3978226.1 hypothetical protein [Amycolatopsis sp. H20-H5]
MHPPSSAAVPPLGARRDRFAPVASLRAARAAGTSCPITTVSGHVGALVAGHAQARTVHSAETLSLGECHHQGVPPSAPTPSSEIAFRRDSFIHGIDSLPLTW